MGCSQSRLDDEEAVQLCKDRKGFIKQAVEQRACFASEHIAYIQSLQKVSVALRDYIEGDDQPHELLDPFIKNFTPTTMEYEPRSVKMNVNYLRPSGNRVVSVEERVQSPEMIQVEEYPPMEHFGIEGFFAMNSSFFSCNSPNSRPNLPPPSPQASQWESYWNPFSPLDYNNYPIRSTLDETRGEEEGIPDLEEDEIETTSILSNVLFDQSGERVRIAYEKKCMLFRDQDVNGEDLSSVDKTRAAIRDMHTQITVSMHSVEAISKRIETLRDEELHPQLLQLLKGLARMWKVMAECHHTQKRILDEAKILLPRKQSSSLAPPDPQRLARSASSLETELKNWRTSFESCIVSQRSYVQALTGWLLRCVRSEPDNTSPPIHPIFGLCVQWSKHLDAIHETSVLEGIDFFAASIGSLGAQEIREDSCGNSVQSKESGGNMEVKEEVVAMGGDGIRVVCDGMRVAMSSLADFAKDYSEGYDALVKQWENVKWEHQPLALP